MLKYNFYQQIYSLLLLFVFITSCNGQIKPPLSEGNQALRYLPNEQNVKLDTSQISEYIVEIFEDTKGNLWFGTVSDGVVRYNGKMLTYFSTKDGLCDNTVTGIAEDKDGNMWFGTHNGISKYDGKKFTTFAETKGQISGCKILIDRKGQIWAGTTEGAFRFNGTSFSKFDIPNPVIENKSYKWVVGKVWGLMEDKKGNIWFGRDGLVLANLMALRSPILLKKKDFAAIM
jgi:ligand-binding sensor domain-containing protein